MATSVTELKSGLKFVLVTSFYHGPIKPEQQSIIVKIDGPIVTVLEPDGSYRTYHEVIIKGHGYLIN